MEESSCGCGESGCGSPSRREVLGVLAAVAAVPLVSGGMARAAENDEPKPGDAPKEPTVKGWIPTVKAADLVDKAAVQVKDQPVILTRDGKTVVALYTKCTHKACSVKTKPAQTTLNCLCHGARFDMSGAVLKGPAKDPLERFPIRLNKDGVVEVDTSKRVKRDAPEGALTLT